MYLFICFLGCLHFVRAAPLEKIMVDMSYTYDETVKNYITWDSFNMTVTVNGTEPYGFWAQLEDIRLSTHTGTHIDAPAHFAAGALYVDQLPLTSLIAPAAVINIVDRAAVEDEAAVTIEDLEAWESKTGHSLDGMIVLLNSGWGAKCHNISEYVGTTERDSRKFKCPGFSVEAAQWLVDNRKIIGVGSDSLSFDRCSLKDFPSHQVLLPAGMIGLERVANVDKIPIYGATLHVLPMKIGRGSGGPTRIIATYPKVMF